MKFVYTVLVLLFVVFGATAQTTNTQKIQEVYGTSYFDNNPSLLQKFNDLLDRRIHYVQQAESANEKYTKLSQVSLMTKINPNVSRDLVFDANTFNPLKYNLNFFAATTQIYRIDNSGYLLVIDPQ